MAAPAENLPSPTHFLRAVRFLENGRNYQGPIAKTDMNTGVQLTLLRGNVRGQKMLITKDKWETLYTMPWEEFEMYRSLGGKRRTRKAKAKRKQTHRRRR